jgi:hypothetical protein
VNKITKAPEGFEPRRRGHTKAYLELLNVAKAAREAGDVWVIPDGMTFMNASSARMLAYRIRSGRKAAFNEVGKFDATWKATDDGAFTVLVKYAG